MTACASFTTRSKAQGLIHAPQGRYSNMYATKADRTAALSRCDAGTPCGHQPPLRARHSTRGREYGTCYCHTHEFAHRASPDPPALQPSLTATPRSGQLQALLALGTSTQPSMEDNSGRTQTTPHDRSVQQRSRTRIRQQRNPQRSGRGGRHGHSGAPCCNRCCGCCCPRLHSHP